MSYQYTAPRNPGNTGLGIDVSGGSSIVSAAGSVITGALDLVYGIRGARSGLQAFSSRVSVSESQMLEESRYQREAATMAAQEVAAQAAADSEMSATLTTQQQDIARETARLRREQARRDISARIGGRYGAGSFPSWGWWGLGIGGVGLTFLVIWLVSRKG